jgi:mannan endo-1,4-beta-mannosidase
MAATTETYANQYGYFQLTYDYARNALNSRYGYKGIMFWRWAAVDPTANAGGFDQAATISAPSFPTSVLSFKV